MWHYMERMKAEGRPDNLNMKIVTCLYTPALLTPFLRGTGESKTYAHQNHRVRILSERHLRNLTVLTGPTNEYCCKAKYACIVVHFRQHDNVQRCRGKGGGHGAMCTVTMSRHSGRNLHRSESEQRRVILRSEGIQLDD